MQFLIIFRYLFSHNMIFNSHMKSSLTYFVSLAIFLGLLAVSCEPKSTSDINKYKTPVCQGFNVTDENGNFTGVTIGTPNIKTDDETSDVSFVAFPNPSNSLLNISINPALNTQKVTVWILWAKSDPTYLEDEFIFDEPPAEQIENPVFTYESDTSISEMLLINTMDLQEGFYKMYVQFDNVLLWDNILILEDVEEFLNEHLN